MVLAFCSPNKRVSMTRNSIIGKLKKNAALYSSWKLPFDQAKLSDRSFRYLWKRVWENKIVVFMSLGVYITTAGINHFPHFCFHPISIFSFSSQQINMKQISYFGWIKLWPISSNKIRSYGYQLVEKNILDDQIISLNWMLNCPVQIFVAPWCGRECG